MSKKKTDKVIDFQSALEKESEKDMRAAFEKAVGATLHGEEDSKENMAYDLLEQAENASSPKSAVKFAQMALNLCPDLIQAECLIASVESKDTAEYQAELERLLKKAESILEKQGVTRDRDAGDYYQIYETRPLMEIYREYLTVLITQGKMRKAIAVCNDILFLNEGDNLGVRYTLMGLYAILEDQIPAEELYKKFPENRAHMLLPLICLYYKLDNTREAEKYLTLLCKNNKEVRKGLEIIEAVDEERIDEIMTSPFYEPYTASDLVSAYMTCLFLFEGMSDFVPWLMANLPKEKKTTSRATKKK